MTATLLIEHAVTDLATWQAAYDRFAGHRDAAGVRADRVYRPTDDPRHVVVLLEFDGAAPAAAFREFLRTRVWADPAASPALAGPPRATLLEPVPVSRPATTPR